MAAGHFLKDDAIAGAAVGDVVIEDRFAAPIVQIEAITAAARGGVVVKLGSALVVEPGDKTTALVVEGQAVADHQIGDVCIGLQGVTGEAGHGHLADGDVAGMGA